MIKAHGVAILSGSLPHLSSSNGVAAIIDNGVGSYQFVLDKEVKDNYTLLVTPKETEEEKGVFACERSFYERSSLDFLVELKDQDGDPVDADINFAIIGEELG